MGPIDRALHAWETTPAGSVGRRVLFSLLLGVGLTMTFGGSIFFPPDPIPLKLIPDLRIVGPLALGLGMGLLASVGGVSQRKPALWTAVGVIVLFHLEEATVSWIGLPAGGITESRVGALGTAGSLLALLAVLLLHVEVEATRLARDLAGRGADAVATEHARAALVGHGTRRLLGLAAGVAALGVAVRAGELVLGEQAPPGGAFALFLGAGLLAALALFLLRIAKRKDSEAAPAADADAADALAGQREGA